MTIPNGTARLGKIKDKEMREVIAIARAANWTVWRTKGGHLRFRPPAGSPRPAAAGDHEDNRGGGRTLTHGTSDSDQNGMKNFRADLRREGLEGV